MVQLYYSSNDVIVAIVTYRIIESVKQNERVIHPGTSEHCDLCVKLHTLYVALVHGEQRCVHY